VKHTDRRFELDRRKLTLARGTTFDWETNLESAVKRLLFHVKRLVGRTRH
jgi:hypothetical protein